MTDDVSSNDGPIQGAFRIDEDHDRGHVDKIVRLLDEDIKVALICKNAGIQQFVLMLAHPAPGILGDCKRRPKTVAPGGAKV